MNVFEFISDATFWDALTASDDSSSSNISNKLANQTLANATSWNPVKVLGGLFSIGVRDYMGKVMRLDSQGHQTPSMLGFFTSNYAGTLMFLALLINRIHAIVAPRHPAALPWYYRIGLRLPSLLMLSKVVMLLSLSIIKSRAEWMLAYVPQFAVTSRQNYTDGQVLWYTFATLALVSIVEVSTRICLILADIQTFSSSLEHNAVPRDHYNLFEYAIMFHFQSYSESPNPDILIIALLVTCELLSLQISYLFPHGSQYKLVITTFWGLMSIAHFLNSTRSSSNQYPMLQFFSRLPEVGVLLILGICIILQRATELITSGDVRRPLFGPRTHLPQWDEDFSIALFKLGTIVLEATRVAGLSNELDGIVMHQHSYVDRMPPRLGYANERTDLFIRKEGREGRSRGPYEMGILTGRSERWSQLGGFYGSVARACKNMSMQSWRFLTHRPAPQAVAVPEPIDRFDGNFGSNARLDSVEPEVHQQLWRTFQSRSFSPHETPDVDGDFVPEDVWTDESDDDRSSTSSDVEREPDEKWALMEELQEASEAEASSAVVTHLGGTSTIPIFLTHLMHPTRLTRSRYKMLLEPSRQSERAVSEAQLLLNLVNERRDSSVSSRSSQTPQPVTMACVVCHTEPRRILLWPCRCLALCSPCREIMAVRQYKLCPCCRAPVEGFSRIFTP